MTGERKGEKRVITFFGCLGCMAGFTVLCLAWIVLQLLWPNAFVSPASPDDVKPTTTVLGPAGQPPGAGNIYDQPRPVGQMRRATEGDIKPERHVWSAEKGRGFWAVGARGGGAAVTLTLRAVKRGSIVRQRLNVCWWVPGRIPEPHDPAARMLALANTFPCLRRKGITQWDSAALERESRPWSWGERCAVVFLLSVWNPFDYAADFGLQPWDLHEALKGWDDECRAAFVAWAAAPWWP